ncbi:MAG: hybrid sensor histidine kinase/response regulator [Gammaproteobacteria bacterium]|nr:MAG: hybrid sensor histidine kinase/response regulator [Gammaproteobacteria bacterium]
MASEKKLHVLIVDDSRALRAPLRHVLETIGFVVEEAESGEAALEFLCTTIPDAILLDVTMPGMGGFAACKKIRAAETTKYLPVLIITSLGDLESINKAYQAGATDFITKPINWDLIGYRIRYMVRASRDFIELQKTKEALDQLNLELEQRVEQRTQELEAAIKKLKMTQVKLVESEKLASLGEMVAGIAHEVNTPLGISVTSISLLNEKVNELAELSAGNQLKRPQFEAFLETSKEAVQLLNNNLKRAVEMIKSFKQVSADQLSEQSRRFDLKSYLEEIVFNLKPAIKKTRLQTSIDCPEKLTIHTYPGILFQLMTIFIMNSIIHGYEPNEEGTLSITVEPAGDNIILRYQDTGKGIPPENIKKVFDPFFTTRRGSGSTGLGLNIAYSRVTQTLGGSIKCESTVGKGVTFTIIFPKECSAKEAGHHEK